MPDRCFVILSSSPSRLWMGTGPVNPHTTQHQIQKVQTDAWSWCRPRCFAVNSLQQWGKGDQPWQRVLLRFVDTPNAVDWRVGDRPTCIPTPCPAAKTVIFDAADLMQFDPGIALSIRRGASYRPAIAPVPLTPSSLDATQVARIIGNPQVVFFFWLQPALFEQIGDNVQHMHHTEVHRLTHVRVVATKGAVTKGANTDQLLTPSLLNIFMFSLAKASNST